ncbi:MAG: tripartite tricarboxylate transporter substrate binding protein [Alphaproteobacteria bacterium]|nr:tripartite tricarboxylate transporter substrate binding protein [Alphaproteobacteria bacterium]
MRMFIRVAALAAALLFAGFGGASHADTYPSKTVRIIVPFAAGGPTDVVARLIAQKLSERLGQPFIIENQAGAGGNIGMGNAARAAPDGYTILFVSSSYVVNPSLYTKVPYDPDKDFAPVTKAAATPHALIVNPSVTAKDVNALVAQIKADPAKFNIASPGIGTAPHLSIELFKQAFGLNDLLVVPFNGGNPAIQAVVAGHTPLSFQAIPPATALIKDGKLRALAITAAQRSPILPDVPTMDELGAKGQEAETMQGVLVPAGTPKEIVDLLQREIAAAIALPDVKEKIITLGFEPSGISSAEFAAYIKSEIAKWRRVIEQSHMDKI